MTTATLPLIEQITEAIVGRLELVDTIKAVVRQTRDGQLVDSRGKRFTDPEDGFCVVFQGDSSSDSETLSMGGKCAWKTDYELLLFNIPSDNTDDPADLGTNELIAETMVGLSTSPDGRPWGRWNGLAIESNFTDITLFQGSAGERSGAVLKMQVQHRHLENDPYTAA